MAIHINNIKQVSVSEELGKGIPIVTEDFANTYLFLPEKNLKLGEYEDQIQITQCPIGLESIKDGEGVMLGSNYFNKENLDKCLKIKLVNPLTNLPIKKEDLHKNIPSKIIFRKLFKDKYQYSAKIHKVIIYKNEKKILFMIKDTEDFINIYFDQILRYELKGFIKSHSSLQIEIKSKLNNQPGILFIQASNLSFTLFNILNDIYGFES